MRVRMPDGTIVENVPEGTTKEQLMAKFARRDMARQKAEQAQQFTPPQESLATGDISAPVQPTPVSTQRVQGGIVDTRQGAQPITPPVAQSEFGTPEFDREVMSAEADIPKLFKRSAARVGEGVAALAQIGSTKLGEHDEAAAIGKVRAKFQGWVKEAEESLTPSMQRSIQLALVERDENDNLKLGEGGKDAGWWLANGIDMGVMMAPGIGTSAGAARLAYGAEFAGKLAKLSAAKIPQSVAIAAAEKAAMKSATRAAVIAGGLTEGGLSGGMNASQVEQTINEVDEQTMMNYEPYRVAREQGKTHEQARAEVATDRAFATGIATATVTGLTGAPLNAWIARWATKSQPTVGRIRNAAEGAVLEGGQEFVQEGADQLISNVAEQPITGKDTWEGVLEGAITGATLGGVLGGGLGAATGGKAKVDNSGKKPPESPELDVLRKKYEQSQENVKAAGEAASDPTIRISNDDVQAAKEEHRANTVAFGQALLKSGKLDAKAQKEVAAALQQAQAAGEKIETKPIEGEIRTDGQIADQQAAAGEQPAPAGKQGVEKPVGSGGPAATNKVESGKNVPEGTTPQVPPVTAAETARQDILNRVATADTVDEAEIAPLIAEGLVRANKEGRPILAVKGRQQRKMLNERVAAAEQAELAAKEAAKKPVTKAAEKAKTPAKTTPTVEKNLVTKPAVTPAPHDNKAPVTVQKKMLPAERRAKLALDKTGAGIATAKKIERHVKSVQTAAMFTEREQELEVNARKQKDRDFGPALNQVADENLEVAKFLAGGISDEDLKETPPSAMRQALQRAEAALADREKRAKARLSAALSAGTGTQGTLFDVTAAGAEAFKRGSKLWISAAEVGAYKIARGAVRFADWAAQMSSEFDGVDVYLEDLYKEAKKIAKRMASNAHTKWKTGTRKGQARGAPAGTKGNALTKLRKAVAGLAEEGADYRMWYEESGKAVLQLVSDNPEQARQLAGLLSIYSSGTGVGPNTTNAMKAWYQYRAGQPIMAGRFRAQDRMAAEWLESGIEPTGMKRSNFYTNLMRQIAPEEYSDWQGATVDMWMMRAFGYGTEVPTEAQYGFVSGEIARLSEQLGWEPQQVQAAIWVAAKTRYESTAKAAETEALRKKLIKYVQNKKGELETEVLKPEEYAELRREMALTAALDEDRIKIAGKSYADTFRESVAQLNWEALPSPNSGILPGAFRATPEQHAEYLSAIAQAFTDPRTGVDLVAQRLGTLSLGQVEGPSAWFRGNNDFFRFRHFSNLDGEQVTLDPAAFGSGIPGAERARKGIKVISLYPEDLPNDQIEQGLAHKTEYTVEIPKGALYDANGDPLGFYEKARKVVAWDMDNKPQHRKFDMNAFEKLIKDAGYDGYYTPQADGILRGQARLFVKYPAIRADKVSAFKGYSGSGARNLVAVPTRHGNSKFATQPETDASAAKKLDAHAALIGLLLHQDSVSWTKSIYARNLSEANGVDLDVGRQLDKAETLKLYTETHRLAREKGLSEDEAHGFAPITNDHGAYFMNFTSMSNRDFRDLVKAAAGRVFTIQKPGEFNFSEDAAVVPYANIDSFAAAGGFVGNNWKENPDGTGYRQRLKDLGEQETLDWALATLRPRIEQINRDFARKYKWGRTPKSDPKTVLFSVAEDSERLKPGTGVGTAAFKKWFGKSKIKRPDGSPLTIFHGSNKDFREFMPAAEGNVGAGIYFTDVEKEVNRYAGGETHPDYAGRKGRLADEIQMRMRDDPAFAGLKEFEKFYKSEEMAEDELNKDLVVYAGYLKMENPLRMDPADRKNNTMIDGAELAQALVSMGVSVTLADTIDQDSLFTAAHAKEVFIDMVGWDDFSTGFPEFVRLLGYDGVIQSGYHFMKYGAKHYIVFRPNQFKSYFNSGTWNGDVDDMAMRASEKRVVENGGLPHADLKKVAAEVQRDLGVTIKTVGTVAELPDNVKEFVGGRRVMGMFVQSPASDPEMFLIGENIGSINDARETAIHEVVGHMGLRGVLGERYLTEMARIGLSFTAETKAAAKRNSIPWNPTDIRQRMLNRALAAEELVAYASQKVLGPTAAGKDTVWGRIVAFVREVLRGVGWLKDYNEADVEALIYRARDYVRRKSAKRRVAEAKYNAEVANAAFKISDMAADIISRIMQGGKPTKADVRELVFQTRNVRGIPESQREALQTLSLQASEGGDQQALVDKLLDIYLNPEAKSVVGQPTAGIQLTGDFSSKLGVRDPNTRPIVGGGGYGKLDDFPADIKSRFAFSVALPAGKPVPTPDIKFDDGVSVLYDELKALPWFKGKMSIADLPGTVTQEEDYDEGIDPRTEAFLQMGKAGLRRFLTKQPPLIVWKKDGPYIQDGNHRIAAARQLGITNTPVLFADERKLKAQVAFSVANDGALLGMPRTAEIPGVGTVDVGPYKPARFAAFTYRRHNNIETPEVRTFAKVNPATAKRIGDAFDVMEHAPSDPTVKAAYDAMIKETLAQYQYIKSSGLKIEFITGEDPYKASPRMAIEDVKKNDHLWVFPTDAGFGKDGPDAAYLQDNPMLKPTTEKIGDRVLLANDVFRIVHDYFGHIQEGNGFRADGEENAWRIHSTMYSPLARRAMTTETRGQNSWLNFGPFGDRNRTAKSEDTVYAPQKIGLLPEEFSEPYGEEFEAFAIRESRTPPPPNEVFGKAIGPLVAKIYDSLSYDGKAFVDGWNVNWDSDQGRMRDRPIFKEVVAAYQPVRDKLRAIYGDRVPAYRGEQKGREPSKADRFLFSWTPLQNLATSFAVGRTRGIPAAIPQSKVDEQVVAYKKTGVARLAGYKYERRNPGDYAPDGPDYYYIFQHGEMLTDGSDIAKELQHMKDERDEWRTTLRARGDVYFAKIPVDSIYFVPATFNLREPEYVAEYNPRVDSASNVAFSVLGGNTGDPDLDSFLSKVGGPRRTLKQMWQEWTDGIADRGKLAVFDQFHGIKRAEDLAGISSADSGYISARLSGNSGELVQAMLEYGHPVWNDGAPDVAGTTGLLGILKPLGSNVNLWLAYVVAKRANRLAGQGRENLFTQAEMAAALRLGQTHPEFDVVAAAYADFQKKVLDFAQDAGIIDPNSRALWENADYIPFYRVIENGEVGQTTSGGAIGKVRNQIRKLKGGKANLGDPLENIVRNWLALTDAALKAHAGRQIIDNLNGTGLVSKAPQVEFTQAIIPKAEIKKFLKTNPQLVNILQAHGLDVTMLPPAAFAGLQTMLAVQAPTGEDIVSIWRNGKREYWHAHDSLLYQSLQGINAAAWGPFMELFRYPKRILTATITSTPVFAIRNIWRDMWHVFVQGTPGGTKIPIIPLVDTIKGTISQIRMDPASQSMQAGGGAFIHGYVRGGDTEGAAKTVRQSLHRNGPGIVLDTPGKMWRMYTRALNAAENSHRVAIYNKALAGGKTRKESLFEARDTLDFSMRGNNALIRFFVESVPFLNARMQGLYRLGRGFKENPAGIALRGLLLTAASVALLARNFDDERYKGLTEDQKNTYWHFFDVLQEGDHWRIPKPFEVGTIFGTIPEAIGDAILTNADEPDAMRQSAKLLGHAFTNSLNLSPKIQLVWPILELAINQNTFTGAPILNMGDEGVLPEDQDSPSVSPSYRFLANAMPDVAPEALRSPKQLQHLGRGYIGGIQEYVLLASDAIARAARGEPAAPKAASSDIPVIGDFRSVGPARNTKYGNAIYEIADEASKVHRSILKAEAQGSDEGDARAEQLGEENEQLLDVYEDFKTAADQINDLRKEQRAIQLDPDMTPLEKREELDIIQGEMNEIAKEVWDLRPGGKLNPDVAAELIGATSKQQVDILKRNGLEATARLVEQAK